MGDLTASSCLLRPLLVHAYDLKLENIQHLTSLSHCTFLLDNHRDFQNFVACSLEDRSHNLGHHKFGALLVAGEEEGALGPLDLQDWPCFFSHSDSSFETCFFGEQEYWVQFGVLVVAS